mmetsp:Transcript_44353/g.111749  ORF Transcript_44353/g.111749 Transcript_44353/m.111749 type:complete len:259 (+) Transcript_44353:604-1380(+)
MIDGVVVEVLSRNHRLDDVLLELGNDVLLSDGRIVLGADHHGVNAHGRELTAGALVLHGHLGLCVGAQPLAGTVVAHLGETAAQLAGQHVGERHHLGGLVGGVAKHDTLITGSHLLGALVQMHSTGDLGALLLDSGHDVAGLEVETLVGVIKTDALDCPARDLLVVQMCLAGDLTKDEHQAGFHRGLTGHLTVRILSQAGVQHGVTDLVTDLVRMTFAHTLGGEEERTVTLLSHCGRHLGEQRKVCGLVDVQKQKGTL